jgi:hypothetical protein
VIISFLVDIKANQLKDVHKRVFQSDIVVPVNIVHDSINQVNDDQVEDNHLKYT